MKKIDSLKNRWYQYYGKWMPAICNTPQKLGALLR